jgi:hypothetical protein
MLFLDWFSENEPHVNMTWVKPTVITRADMGLNSVDQRLVLPLLK